MFIYVFTVCLTCPKINNIAAISNKSVVFEAVYFERFLECISV